MDAIPQNINNLINCNISALTDRSFYSNSTIANLTFQKKFTSCCHCETVKTQNQLSGQKFCKSTQKKTSFIIANFINIPTSPITGIDNMEFVVKYKIVWLTQYYYFVFSGTRGRYNLQAGLVISNCNDFTIKYH